MSLSPPKKRLSLLVLLDRQSLPVQPETPSSPDADFQTFVSRKLTIPRHLQVLAEQNRDTTAIRCPVTRIAGLVAVLTCQFNRAQPAIESRS